MDGWTRPRLFLAVLLVLATGFFAWRTAHRRNTGDLVIYYEAGTRLRTGLDIYAERESERPEHPTGYIYPPPFALIMAPLSLLPFRLVRGLWFVLGVLCALRAFQLSARLIERVWPPPTPRAAGVAIALGVALTARAIWNDLGHGQINLVLVALTLEAVWATERRRDVLAGCLFAVAVVLKVVPALLVVAYLLQRRWKLIGTTAATGLALLFSPALLLGASGWFDVTTRFVGVTRWHAAEAAGLLHNVTPSGAIFRWLAGYPQAFGEPLQRLGLSLDPAAVRAGCTLLSLVVFVGTLTWVTQRWGADPDNGDAPAPERARSLALLCAAIPLISPVAWKPHLAWLILPGLLTGRLLLVPGRHRWLLGAAWAVMVLTGRFPLGRELSNASYLWGLPAISLVLLFAGLLAASPAVGERVSTAGEDP